MHEPTRVREPTRVSSTEIVKRERERERERERWSEVVKQASSVFQPHCKHFLKLGGSPGPVVMGGDSCNKRAWVRIPAPYTGWTFFTYICN